MKIEHQIVREQHTAGEEKSALWRYCILFLLSVLLVVGCAPAPAPLDSNVSADDAVELTPVTLGVGYIPSVQFAPFYVGAEKGFFADEGIDLELGYGFENDYLKLVGTGEERFLIGSGDQVVLARAQGLPVRYVMNWYTRYPVVIFAKRDVGIERAADLAGRTVGIPGPFGATYVAFRAILESAGISERDVQTESIGFTQAAAVNEGTVDAAADYAVSGPVVLEQQGIDTVQIALDDYISIPSNGLIANERTIEEEPELVRGLVRALQRSIDYTLANPDEAFDISLAAMPAGDDGAETSRAIYDAVLPYWRPVDGRTPGASTFTQWEETAALMQRIGLVDTLVPTEQLLTNEFVGDSDRGE